MLHPDPARTKAILIDLMRWKLYECKIVIHLHFLATVAHCWLMGNLLSTFTDPAAGLGGAWSAGPTRGADVLTQHKAPLNKIQ